MPSSPAAWRDQERSLVGEASNGESGINLSAFVPPQPPQPTIFFLPSTHLLSLEDFQGT